MLTASSIKRTNCWVLHSIWRDKNQNKCIELQIMMEWAVRHASFMTGCYNNVSDDKRQTVTSWESAIKSGILLSTKPKPLLRCIPLSLWLTPHKPSRLTDYTIKFKSRHHSRINPILYYRVIVTVATTRLKHHRQTTTIILVVVVS